jgi:hypothetical protein
MPPPRDGAPEAVLPAIVPDLATAVALVASPPPGAMLGLAAARPLHGPLGPQGRQDGGVVSVARDEDACHELAVACRPHLDLGPEAPWTPAECGGGGVSWGGTRRLWMRPDHSSSPVVGGPIACPCGGSTWWPRRQEASPEPRLLPAIKTAGDSAPGARPLREVTPKGAGTQAPEDTVEETTMSSGGTAGCRLLRRQERLEPFSLFIRKFISFHTMTYTT